MEPQRKVVGLNHRNLSVDYGLATRRITTLPTFLAELVGLEPTTLPCDGFQNRSPHPTGVNNSLARPEGLEPYRLFWREVFCQLNYGRTLAAGEGIEPPTPGPRPGALPLNYPARLM